METRGECMIAPIGGILLGRHFKHEEKAFKECRWCRECIADQLSRKILSYVRWRILV